MNRSNLRLLEKAANKAIATKRKSARNRAVVGSRVAANKAEASKAADDRPCIVN